MTPKKLKPIKAWAVYLTPSYELASIYRDKRTAEFWRGPDRSAAEVIPVFITPIQHKPKTKKK